MSFFIPKLSETDWQNVDSPWSLEGFGKPPSMTLLYWLELDWELVTKFVLYHAEIAPFSSINHFNSSHRVSFWREKKQSYKQIFLTIHNLMTSTVNQEPGAIYC